VAPAAVIAVFFAVMAVVVWAGLSAIEGRILAGAVLGVLAVLAVAVVAGEALANEVAEQSARLVTDAVAAEKATAAREMYERCRSLRALIGRGLDDLHQFVGRVEGGELPMPADVGERPAEGRDPFELVAYDIHRVTVAAQGAVFETAGAAAREREAARLRVYDRCRGLLALIGRGVDELQQSVDAVKGGTGPAPADVGERPAEGGDPFEAVAWDVHRALAAAQRTVIEAAQTDQERTTPTGLQAHVVNTLALRMQARIHRALLALEQILGQVDDPDLLEGLYTVDHLVVLLRRQAENLAVIGGGSPRRLWTTPVSITSTVRAAVQEVEHYSRVRWVPPADGVLRGDVVADIIHLLAELVENATEFSPRHRVWIRVEKVSAGLAIEIEDKGFGFSDDADRRRMNELLADPGQVSLDELLSDGRIGLWVVGKLAGRHGVVVQLKNSVYGGVLAVVVLPEALIASPAVAPVAVAPPGRAARYRQADAMADMPAPALAAAQTASPAGSAPATDTTLGAEHRSSADSNSPDGMPADGMPADGAPVRAPQVASSGTSGNGTGDETSHESPPLPQRVRQQSLVPELRQPPTQDSGDTADTDTDLAFTAALLGSFRETDSPPPNTSPADSLADTQAASGDRAGDDGDGAS
jgi:hypothetical protein